MTNLPHNIEAEQAILGALLVNNAALDALGALEPEDFYDPVHARIYALMRERIAGGSYVHHVTLRHLLEGDEGLKELGGPSYLGLLADAAISVLNAGDFAEVVRETAARRRAALALSEAAERAADMLADMGEVSRAVDAALAGAAPAEWSPAQSLAAAMVERLESLRRQSLGLESSPAIPTGSALLDRRLGGGLMPGEVVTIGARPGMGKTALAIAMVLAAARAGHGVLFVSREMPPHQIADRVVSALVAEQGYSLPYSALRRPAELEDWHFEAMAEAAQELVRLPIEFAAGSTVTLGGVVAEVGRARRAMARQGAALGLVVIDYLQLLRGDGKTFSRTEELSQITAGAKTLARREGLGVVLLSQLSRQVEQRTDKRPQLSDLRESGSIEQDSDAVLMLYRAEEYLKHEQPSDPAALIEWERRMEDAAGVMEVIAAKVRAGSTGTDVLAVDLARNLVRDTA